MLSIKKNKEVHLHQLDGVDYLLLNGWTENILQVIHHYDAILIATTSREDFEDLVKRIRVNQSKSVFLKPMFYKFDIKSHYTAHTDGAFQGLVSNEDVKQINKKIKEVKEIKAASSVQQTGLQILQYIFTRTGSLNPKKNRHSKLSYQFPYVDLFFEEEEFSVIQTLQELTQSKLLEEKLQDRVQLCHECHDGFLMFKETCPKCSSIDIQAFDVIHHFKCAHIAPETQFKNDDNDDLVCPKCDKNLRHIGIDYDKPSSVYHCRKCDHDFQNAQVVAECHSCDKKNQFEELVEIRINNYKMTVKGMNIAQKGTYRDATESSVSHETIFYELVKHEAARSKKTGNPSFIVEVNIKSPFFAMLGEQYQQKYWTEIRTIIKDYVLFDSHILVGKDKLHFILLDQNQEECEATCKRLQYNLTILLEDNLGGNIKIEVDYQSIVEL